MEALRKPVTILVVLLTLNAKFLTPTYCDAVSDTQTITVFVTDAGQNGCLVCPLSITSGAGVVKWTRVSSEGTSELFLENIKLHDAIGESLTVDTCHLTNHSLELIEVAKNHNDGVYNCLLDDTHVASFKVAIQVTPRLQIIQRLTDVQENMKKLNATGRELTCNVLEAVPPVVFTWSRDGTIIEDLSLDDEGQGIINFTSTLVLNMTTGTETNIACSVHGPRITNQSTSVRVIEREYDELPNIPRATSTILGQLAIPLFLLGIVCVFFGVSLSVYSYVRKRLVSSRRRESSSRDVRDSLPATPHKIGKDFETQRYSTCQSHTDQPYADISDYATKIDTIDE